MSEADCNVDFDNDSKTDILINVVLGGIRKRKE